MRTPISTCACLATLALIFACSQGSGGGSTTYGGSASTTPGTSSDSTSENDDEPEGTSTSTDSEGDEDEGGDEDSEAPKFDLMGDFDSPLPPSVGIPETCEEAETAETTVGCRFFGVDLPTFWDHKPYAIVVANVQQDTVANVEVDYKDGPQWITLDSQVIEPNEVFVFETVPGEGFAFRLESDTPVIAYQFNPLIGGSATSDASMLYPVSSWDTSNHVIGWIRVPGSNLPAYATVVSAHDGTLVTVTPSVETLAIGNAVPDGEPGIPYEVELPEGHAIIVEVEHGEDSITGTVIESNEDHPVGVFSGSICSYVPDGVLACDHLEEQLAGLRLWGMSFVAARLPPREPNTPEDQLWQIYASEDDTTISFSAAAEVTGLPASPLTLDAGEKLEFLAGGSAAAPGDFLVEADKPIGILGYMTGADSLSVPQTNLGDPSMIQINSVEQFLPRYVIYVPEQWVNDYVVLTRPAGANLSIDGVAVIDEEFTALGSYEVARVPISDGVHVLEGNAAFGVMVTGYDDHDSYAYLGGTGTSFINPTPEG